MDLNVINVIIIIISAIVLLAIGFLLGILVRKKIGEAKIGSAEEEAKRIINDAIKLGETKQKEALLEAKEEIHKNRSEAEKETNDLLKELRSIDAVLGEQWSSIMNLWKTTGTDLLIYKDIIQ